jgi:hypothetical protein
VAVCAKTGCTRPLRAQQPSTGDSPPPLPMPSTTSPPPSSITMSPSTEMSMSANVVSGAATVVGPLMVTAVQSRGHVPPVQCAHVPASSRSTLVQVCWNKRSASRGWPGERGAAVAWVCDTPPPEVPEAPRRRSLSTSHPSTRHSSPLYPGEEHSAGQGASIASPRRRRERAQWRR